MQIVQIDSVSGEEEQMVHYLTNFLNTKCHLAPKKDMHNNVFLQTNGTGEPILFNAHIDTVEPGKGIIPKLENGTITSQGSTILGADDKGAVAALLSALQYISQNPSQNWKPLDILFTTSEEDGCFGAIGFDKTQIRANIGYIFDGSGLVGNIMSKAPFYARINIQLKGIATHAAYQQQATSAIPTMLSVITQLESIRSNEVFINIGEIHAGTARNAVIGMATLKGEIRCFDPHLFEQAMLKTREILEKEYECQLIFEVVKENPGYSFSEDDIAPIKKKLEYLLGRTVSVVESFGVSDANIFNEDISKLKVFNLGDGSSGAHTVDESTTVEALETMRDLILKLAQNERENHV